MSSNSKSKAPKSKAVSFAPSTTDDRFSSFKSSARFRLPSKKHTKTKLDKRLSGILNDDAFSKKATVDRYGRKLSSDQTRKDLTRLYRLASDDEEEENSGDDDRVVSKELQRVEKKYDPARDGGFSTSESESESEDESEVEEDIEAALPDAGADEVPMGEVSSRLAVVNLDWDNIRAEDIMCVASSFAPPEGRIVSVTVYPSEFGRERMEREEVEGPPKEIFQSIAKEKEEMKAKKIAQLVDSNPNDSEGEDEGGEQDSEEEDEKIKKQLLQEDTGAEFDSVALRRYQLDRLKYYYAVISCSGKETAQALYDNMDGQEYLSSANFFDMRFIPDDVDFDNDKPRETCKKVPEGYKPSDFTTDALMHSNVKLTWDADDTKRKEVQKRAFSRKEIDENDLLAYIGSASSSDEEEEDEIIEDDDSDAGIKSTTSKATTRQARREALRTALGLDLEPSTSRKSKKEEKPVGDMQITFTPALSSSTKKGTSVFENEPIPPDETTAEQYKRKARERKALRKERAKARREGLDPDTVQGAIKGSGDEVEEPQANSDDEADEDDPFNDPFFENPSAAIADSRDARRAEKQRKKREAEEALQAKSAQRAELELMMMDDAEGAEDKTFDMKAIQKADKDARKKNKGKKHKDKSKKSETTSAAQSNFEMNLHDPRFSKLYEDPAFAIDPTNPKFRDTEGMRAILGEKRKRGEERVSNIEGKESTKSAGKVDSIKESIARIGKRQKT
ncbi:hypothetical protein BT63DRAFT_422213 [Microthyrium microscopicum]|uniref:Uncharacterized protein n=1 Tax=Microthyrium microscopicum TaxID=703497 RepID=A0A6A6UHL1_9PEZI|nr:hypothetical protein BT63DRAFT_422213 [Microthyrium microscopicum]